MQIVDDMPLASSYNTLSSKVKTSFCMEWATNISDGCIIRTNLCQNIGFDAKQLHIEWGLHVITLLPDPKVEELWADDFTGQGWDYLPGKQVTSA